MKKIFALFIVCLVLLSSFAVNGYAEENIGAVDVYADTLGNPKDVISQYVDYESFKAFLKEQLLACNTNIVISSYNIPFDQAFLNAASELVRNYMPEIFHFERMSAYGNTIFTRLVITYSITGEELATKTSQLEKVVEEMVDGIKDNSSLSQAEKALLLHDRLALRCEYDYTYTKRTSYEALVNRASVCEGYAKAYAVLLDAVGIKNEYCSSDALNHAWNIVYIDNKPYHVDVTFDDPSWATGERGVLGLVQHDNFLRSTEGLRAEDHDATDYISTPVDTTYDEYFWKTSGTSFALVGDEMYYIDGISGELKRYSDHAVLCSVDDSWRSGSNFFWVGNFSKLATDGKNLYYSLAKAVYMYDIRTGVSTKIFEPALSGYNSIYGLEYRDGYLVCDTNTAPPFGGGKSLAQVSYRLPESSEAQTEIAIKASSALKKENGVLKGVGSGTTVKELLSQFENEDLCVFDEKGNKLDADDVCGTGYEIKLTNGEKTVDSLKLLVLGDVDGNGKIDSTDYLRIKSVFIGVYSIDGVYFEAADVTFDGVLDSTDYMRIKSVFIGKYTL